MAIGLMDPHEESRDLVARHNYPVSMPEVGLVSFPLLLVEQDRFRTLLQFVDILTLSQDLMK